MKAHMAPAFMLIILAAILPYVLGGEPLEVCDGREAQPITDALQSDTPHDFFLSALQVHSHRHKELVHTDFQSGSEIPSRGLLLKGDFDYEKKGAKELTVTRISFRENEDAAITEERSYEKVVELVDELRAQKRAATRSLELFKPEDDTLLEKLTGKRSNIRETFSAEIATLTSRIRDLEVTGARVIAVAIDRQSQMLKRFRELAAKFQEKMAEERGSPWIMRRVWDPAKQDTEPPCNRAADAEGAKLLTAGAEECRRVFQELLAEDVDFSVCGELKRECFVPQRLGQDSSCQLIWYKNRARIWFDAATELCGNAENSQGVCWQLCSRA